VGGLFTTAGNHLADCFSIWHTGQPKAPLIVEFHPSGVNDWLGFTTVPGQTYAMEWKENLNHGSWSPFVNDIAGDGTTNTVMHHGIGGLPTRFYRVSTHIPAWDQEK
jgi:hypothetical protein